MSESALDQARKAHERTKDAQQRHVAALQAEKERIQALTSVAMRERISKWGPSLIDLMVAIDAALEASDPLRGAPNEDTMRVSRPSSEGDEGASTRRMREKANDYRKQVGDLAARMASTFGQDLPDRRDFGAHIRWHVDRQRVEDGCQYCEGRETA